MSAPILFRKSGFLTAVGIGVATGRMLIENTSAFTGEIWCIAGLISALTAGIFTGSYFRLRAREFLSVLGVAFLLLLFPWGHVGFAALFLLGFVVKQSDRHLPARLNHVWIIVTLIYLSGASWLQTPWSASTGTGFAFSISWGVISLGLFGLFYIIWKTPNSRILLPVLTAIFCFLLTVSVRPTPAPPPQGEKLSSLTVAYAVLQLEQNPESVFLWNLDSKQEEALGEAGFFAKSQAFIGTTAAELKSVSELNLIIMSIPHGTAENAIYKLISIGLEQLSEHNGVLLVTADAAIKNNPPFIYTPDRRWIVLTSGSEPTESPLALEQNLKKRSWSLNNPSPIPFGILPLLAEEAAKEAPSSTSQYSSIIPRPASFSILNQGLLLAGILLVYFFIRLLLCRHYRNLYGFISLERGFGLGAILVLAINTLYHYELFLPVFPMSLILLLLITARRGEGKADKYIDFLFPVLLVLFAFPIWDFFPLYFNGVLIEATLLGLFFYGENTNQSAMYRDRLFAPALGGKLLAIGVILGALLATAGIEIGIGYIAVAGLALSLKLIYILKL